MPTEQFEPKSLGDNGSKDASQDTAREQPATIAEVVDSAITRWEETGSQILAIEKAAFGDRGFSEEELEREFGDPENVAVILREGATKRIVGYTYAIVDTDFPDGKTAYIESTALLSEYRHFGLVGKLMDKLEEELRKRGFLYLARDSDIPGGYADSIQKHYGERILESYEHESEYGPQRYFRIKL